MLNLVAKWIDIQRDETRRGRCTSARARRIRPRAATWAKRWSDVHASIRFLL